jgi:hypothetical protein
MAAPVVKTKTAGLLRARKLLRGFGSVSRLDPIVKVARLMRVASAFSRGDDENFAFGLEAEPEPSVDEGSITAWATFGAALAEASARLESADRDQLVETLHALVVATGELVDALGVATSE